MQTEPQDTPFEAPGRGGFVPEKLLGRTGDDFESTTYTTMGLEEICLENIVMAHLNQDILKKNFEIIINALRLQTQKIAGLSRHFTNYDDMINEIKESMFHNDKKLEELREKGFASSKDVESQAEKESFIEEIRKLKDKDKEQGREIENLKEMLSSIELKLSGDQKGLEQKVLKDEETLEVHETFSNELQQRVQDLNSKMAEFQAKNDAVLQKLDGIDGKCESLESKMHLVQSLSSGNSKDGPDLSGIINQIANFRRELKDYVLTEDFDSFKTFFSKFSTDLQKPLSKIDPMEFEIEKLKAKLMEHESFKTQINTVAEQNSNLELQTVKKSTELEEKITLIQVNIEGLLTKPKTPTPKHSEAFSPELKDAVDKEISRKVNMEDYLQVLREIEEMKEAMNLLSAQLGEVAASKGEYKPIVQPVTSPTNNAKEMNLIKELGNKVGDLESLIRKVQREVTEHASASAVKIKELGEGVKGLEDRKLEKSEIKLEKIEEMLKKVGGFDNELKGLKEHQFNLEKTVGMHEVSISDVMKELAKLRKKNSVGEVPSINKEMVNKLLEEGLKSLRKEIEAFWAQVGLSLNKKSGLDDLWKLESKTLEKLDELFGLFTKKYCDKNETKKAFIYIENKINQLFQAVFGEKEENTDDDALLAKKPLLWSCASCDKDLEKYQGKLGDFKGWAQFPPKNTSPERMGRFGIGYLRMIEDRKENNAKDWEKIKNSQITNQESTKSVTSYNMFPEIPKKKEKKAVF